MRHRIRRVSHGHPLQSVSLLQVMALQLLEGRIRRGPRLALSFLKEEGP